MPASLSKSVFINCPFDTEYAGLLRAIVFTLIDCGYTPRCALEKSDASEIRIQNIYVIIEQCQHGIHDISRTGLDSKTGLPRFNMPLELGIFLGAKFFGADAQRAKTCLVFDEHPNRYQMYLSDVAGQDISWHFNDPKQIVRRIRDWLADMSDTHIPSAAFIWDHYTTFIGELRHTCSELKQRPDELTYNDLVRHIRTYRDRYSETLTVGTLDQPIINPSASNIRQQIRSLKSRSDLGDAFVVLGKGASGFTYLQATRTEDDKWYLEYQDGHLDKHYRADASQDTETIMARFLLYAEADEHWRDNVNWIQESM